jgi:hypothetical protein
MIKLEEVDVGDLEEGRVYVADEAEEKDYFLAPNPHAHIEDVLQQGKRCVRVLAGGMAGGTNPGSSSPVKDLPLYGSDNYWDARYESCQNGDECQYV